MILGGGSEEGGVGGEGSYIAALKSHSFPYYSSHKQQSANALRTRGILLVELSPSSNSTIKRLAGPVLICLLQYLFLLRYFYY